MPDDGDNVPEVPYVIMKRHSGHRADDLYPRHTGPSPAYHFIMKAI